MSTIRFYSVLSFPFEEHEFFDLVNNDLTWSLGSGQVFSADGPCLGLQRSLSGKHMDFSTTSFGIPVLSSRAADVLMPLISSDVQLLPAEVVDCDTPDRNRFVVNVVSRLACIDETTHSTPMEGDFGCINVTNLRIDPAKAGTHNIFRIAGSEADLVVTHKVRLQIE